MWEPRRLTSLWASTASYRDSFTFFFTLATIKAEFWGAMDLNLKRSNQLDYSGVDEMINISIDLW
jgi:hypothetical protein